MILSTSLEKIQLNLCLLLTHISYYGTRHQTHYFFLPIKFTKFRYVFLNPALQSKLFKY